MEKTSIEVVEVALVQFNLLNNPNQQRSEVLYSFMLKNHMFIC